MTITKKLLTLGVVAGILVAILAFLPGGIKGKFLGSSSITSNAQIKLPPLNSDLNNGYTKNAAGAAIDSQGNIYIADTGNHRIQKFDKSYNFLMKFGTEGSGDGQFKSPQSVVIDTKNNIFVFDAGNNRIQKFDATGKFLMKFGTEGSGDGQFKSPQGVVVDTSSNIYVLDAGNNRIQKFDATGKFLMKFGTEGSADGQFKSPQQVSIDGKNTLYVADTGNHRIQKFDATGKFLMKFGTEGSGDGQFKSPQGVVVDRNAHIWVSDTGNSRMQRFNSTGKHIMTYNNVSEFQPETQKPKKLFITYHTAESNRQVIFIFTDDKILQVNTHTDAKYATTLVGVYFSTLSFLQYGQPIVMKNGEMVTRTYDVRTGFLSVYRFDTGGNLAGKFTLSDATYDVQFDSKGNLYTQRGNRVEKYDMQGKKLSSFEAPGDMRSMIIIDDSMIVQGWKKNTYYKAYYDLMGNVITDTSRLTPQQSGCFFIAENNSIQACSSTDKVLEDARNKFGYDVPASIKGLAINTAFTTYYDDFDLQIGKDGTIYYRVLNGFPTQIPMILVYTPQGELIKRYTGNIGGYINVLSGNDYPRLYRDALGAFYVPPHSSVVAEYPVTIRSTTEDNIDLWRGYATFVSAGKKLDQTFPTKTGCSLLHQEGSTWVCDNPKLEYGNQAYIFRELRGDCTGTQPSCSLLVDGPKKITAIYAPRPRVLDLKVPVTTTRSRTIPITAFSANKYGTSYIISSNGSDPVANDPRWSTVPPKYVVLPVGQYGESYSSYLMNAWTKDIYGNISERFFVRNSNEGAQYISYTPYEFTLGYDGTLGYESMIPGKVILEKSDYEDRIGNTVSSKSYFSEGENITLKAIAGDGYIFTGWTGDCNGQGASCTLTINGNKKTTPIFKQGHQVIYAADEIKFREIQYILPNTQIQSLPKDPVREGYTFEGWYKAWGNQEQISTATIIQGDLTVIAKWVPNTTPINGVCGITNNICTTGTLNDTTDSSTQYLWSCTGKNGGSTALCTLDKPVVVVTPINGVCGTINNACTTGTLNDTTDSVVQYLWSCTGINGGTNASCILTKPVVVTPINGVCGTTNNICTTGTLNDTTDSGVQYLWSCTGINGGTNASCTLDKPVVVPDPINGVCGTTNNICTTGTSVDAVDSGTQYLWSCTGANSGSTASCTLDKPVPSAPLKVKAQSIIGGAKITFDPPTSDGGSAITDYIVEYKKRGESQWKIFDDGVSIKNTITVTDLKNGVYYFRISAKNSQSQSIPSYTVEATILEGGFRR